MNTQLKQKIFEVTYKIYFAQTDAAGVVHHSEYLRLLEAARIDFLDHIECNYSHLQAQKIGFSPIHIDINYIRPLKFGDHAVIESQFINIKNASLMINSKINNQNNECCTRATVKLACLDELNWKIRKIPTILIESLAQFEL